MGKTLSLEYPIYKRTPRKSYVNRVKEQIRCRDAYTLGLTGRGVCVAVLDTGIFPHIDFDNRIVDLGLCGCGEPPARSL